MSSLVSEANGEKYGKEREEPQTTRHSTTRPGVITTSHTHMHTYRIYIHITTGTAKYIYTNTIYLESLPDIITVWMIVVVVHHRGKQVMGIDRIYQDPLHTIHQTIPGSKEGHQRFMHIKTGTRPM